MSKRKQIAQTSLFDQGKLLLKAGALGKLRVLLTQYPDLVHFRDIPDGSGIQHTLLHELSQMREEEWPENLVELAELLISYGAEVNITESIYGGESPLHYAISGNNVELAEVLLKHGANPEQTGRYDGAIDTALGYALFYSLDESLPVFPKNCVDLLLDFGVAYYLPFAAALNDLFFVRNAFEVNGILKEGMGIGDSKTIIQQAFFFACRHGNVEVAHYLLRKGARINEKLPFFNHHATALHLACEQGNQTEMVKFLLENGAQKRLKDEIYNASAEGWAMFCGQDLVYRVLRKV